MHTQTRENTYPLNMELVDRIKYLCKTAGVSVNKMLCKCSLNKSVIDNLKKGCAIAVDKLLTIAEYFKVSVDYLLGRTNIAEINFGAV